MGTILLFLELQGFLNEQHNDIQYQHIDLASENAHACTWTSVDVCLMTTTVVKGVFVIYGLGEGGVFRVGREEFFKTKGNGSVFFFFQYSRIEGISRCFNPFGAVLQIH